MYTIVRMVGLCRALLMLATISVGACGGGDERPAEMPASESPPPAGESATGDPMMDEMMAHVGHMQTMGADSVQAMLPMHRQMVGNMLARMSADMRSMNMGADAAWNALVDSVRTDVIQLPELSPGELEAAMSAHLGRVTRLLESHHTMMRGMRM